MKGRAEVKPRRQGEALRPRPLLPPERPRAETPLIPRWWVPRWGEAWSCRIKGYRPGSRRRGLGRGGDRTDLDQLEERLRGRPDALLLDLVGGDLIRGRLEDEQGRPAETILAERARGHQEVGPGPPLGVELEVR